MQVAVYVSALQAREPAELQLLLEAGACLLDELLHGDAGPGLDGQRGQPAEDPGLERGGGDLRGGLLEQVGLRHEVGLAVQLEQHARLGAVQLGGDQAVGRRAGGPLARVLDALDAQQLDRAVDVAFGFRERVLAVGRCRRRNPYIILLW